MLSFKDGKWLNARFKEMEDSLHQFRFKYQDKHEKYDSLHAIHLQHQEVVMGFKKEFEEEKKLNERLYRQIKSQDRYRAVSVASAWFTMIGLTMWFMVLSSQ